MIIKFFRAYLISLITASSFVTNFIEKSVAQINPDTTLPNNSSVTVEGNLSIIEAGTTQGSNLFHSFKEFNVNNGSEAIFNNPVNIQNIITRVTGQSASNINGVIKASGGANFFLINPNGIIFGENAKLEIGGSFIGSTANAIQFGNFGTFSATNPQAPTPLLTINPSALLFSQAQSSKIESNSIASSGNNPSNAFTARGLRVQDGKSLLLVGGNVSMNNGGLFAFGGRVELGGLAGIGTVALNKDGDNFSLSFPEGTNKSDVSLSNKARVNVRAGDGGSIGINARNLEMTGESVLLAGIQSRLGTNNSKSGNIDVNATETIFLQNGLIYNDVQANALGQGGDINIKTGALVIKDGGQVSANTYSMGQGGNLKVDATSIVELLGTDINGFPSGLFVEQGTKGAIGAAGSLIINTPTLRVLDKANVLASTSGASKSGDMIVNASTIEVIGGSTISAEAKPTATGAAGNLRINTPVLRVLNGGSIISSTFGAGRGGELTIDADKIEVIGTLSNGFASTINVQSNSRATGAAGNLIIKTNELLLKNGGFVSASTFSSGQGGNLKIDATSKIEMVGRNNVNRTRSSGLFVVQSNRGATGNAGSLTINTPMLRVLDGANISASTFGVGRGGELKIDAGKIEVIGTSSDGFASNISAQANSTATGSAGDLTIETDHLIVQDGAIIAALSIGTGTAGNLNISANSINLDNNARLSADTRSNKTDVTQATININSRDLILRRGSSITTNATGSEVVGGDININTDVLGALENSKITANSANARGGNINITTQGLFRSPDSAITASGATSTLNGNVNIITLTDPSRGLVEIPINLVDPSGKILAGCSPSLPQNQNSFIVTGRGGLPISPNGFLQDVNTFSRWVTLGNLGVSKIEQSPIKVQKHKTANPIVEASSLSLDTDGQVYLVASTQNFQSQYVPSKSNLCSQL